MNCPGCQVSLYYHDDAISVQTTTYGHFCIRDKPPLEGHPVEYRKNTSSTSVSVICMRCGYNLKKALANAGIVLDGSGKPHLSNAAA